MIQEAGKFSNRTAEIKPLRPILKKSNTIVVDTDENGDSINPQILDQCCHQHHQQINLTTRNNKRSLHVSFSNKVMTLDMSTSYTFEDRDNDDSNSDHSMGSIKDKDYSKPRGLKHTSTNQIDQNRQNHIKLNKKGSLRSSIVSTELFKIGHWFKK